jgi:predicted nucleic acid-binding protein
VIFLLDTNAVSLRFRRWLASIHADDEVVTNTVVRGEISFGLAQLAEGRRRMNLEAKAAAVLGALRCEPVAPPVADLYDALNNAAASPLTRMTSGSPQRRSRSTLHWLASTRTFTRIDRLTVIEP